MTDASSDRRFDGDVLSAYLAGELDDVTARSLERRLEAEPELAHQLDALADALVALHGADEVEEPEGFARRLQQRLDDERRSGETASGRQRSSRSGWLAGVGAVAAVMVAVALVSSTLVRGGGTSMDAATSGGDVAQTETAELSTDDSDEAATEEAAEPQAADSSVGGGEAADAGTAEPPSPVILDADPARIPGERALRRRYRNLPEVEALLGVSLDDAPALAADNAERVRRHEYSGDAAPQQCLEIVTTEATSPVVPARVERIIYAGRPAIAYVVVTASPDATVLDRVEVWVVATEDCAALVFQQL